MMVMMIVNDVVKLRAGLKKKEYKFESQGPCNTRVVLIKIRLTTESLGLGI